MKKWKLVKSEQLKTSTGPVVTVVMDGVGLSETILGNALANANAPFLKEAMNKYPTLKLKAHGKAVGLPSDQDMGNSEVGHNTMGSGRIFPQGASLVNEALRTGKIWESQAWQGVIDQCHKGGVLHLLGLLSDGNVHSHLDHLKALISRAKRDGVKVVKIHALLDGRDVPKDSALIYINDLEGFLSSVNGDGFGAEIASGGGRMQITMDRYEADWPMVKRGWDTHVLGLGRQFGSAKEAVQVMRQEKPGVIDQDLEAFVIVKDGKAIGKIDDGDAVICFNFRGDRVIEISRALSQKNFDKFERGVAPEIYFAGMMLYDGDLKIPEHFLIEPPVISNSMSELLSEAGITQYAISETQKFGHVTYFWNGNRSGKFIEAMETFEQVNSLNTPFEKQPAMQAEQITNKLIEAVKSGKYQYLRVNYPNGDMIGHTGNYQASIEAIESLDKELERLSQAILEANGVMMITADHGNCEEMYQVKTDGSAQTEANGDFVAKTSHTLNPVPFILVSNEDWKLRGDLTEPGLANLAATVFNLLGFVAPEKYEPSLLDTAK